MSRLLSRVAPIGVADVSGWRVSFAQTTSTTLTENKKFEVISVDGNTLVVKLPEGTREISVPDDFKFTVRWQTAVGSRVDAGHGRDGNDHDPHEVHACHSDRSQER
jgi:hypothetical protein